MSYRTLMNTKNNIRAEYANSEQTECYKLCDTIKIHLLNTLFE